MEFKENVENWSIYANFGLQLFGLDDHTKKVGVFTQGDDSIIILDKLDELGFNTDFLDWFYDSQLDLSMNETQYNVG